jgi:hypothetical protein
MSGHGHESASAPEPVQNRKPQRCSFRRIGAGAKLVEKDQGTMVSETQNGSQSLNPRRKGAEMGPKILLIANLRKNPSENRPLTTFGNGNVEPRLHHGTQKAQSFQGYSFPAGVGATDDKGVLLPR